VILLICSFIIYRLKYKPQANSNRQIAAEPVDKSPENTKENAAEQAVKDEEPFHMKDTAAERVVKYPAAERKAGLEDNKTTRGLLDKQIIGGLEEKQNNGGLEEKQNAGGLEDFNTQGGGLKTNAAPLESLDRQTTDPQPENTTE